MSLEDFKKRIRQRETRFAEQCEELAEQAEAVQSEIAEAREQIAAKEAEIRSLNLQLEAVRSDVESLTAGRDRDVASIALELLEVDESVEDTPETLEPENSLTQPDDTDEASSGEDDLPPDLESKQADSEAGEAAPGSASAKPVSKRQLAMIAAQQAGRDGLVVSVFRDLMSEYGLFQGAKPNRQTPTNILNTLVAEGELVKREGGAGAHNPALFWLPKYAPADLERDDLADGLDEILEKDDRVGAPEEFV